MIDKLDRFAVGVVGDSFSNANAADSAGIDLNIAEGSVINHVFGLIQVVATFATGKFERPCLSCEQSVSFQGSRYEGLFQPKCLRGAQSGQPFYRAQYVVAPDRSRIDQEH